MLFYFACEAAGASSARHSLRPLRFQPRKSSGKLARMRRDRGGVSHVRRPCLVRNCAREQGPITTGLSCWTKVIEQRLSNDRHGVWVPAFAGTTAMSILGGSHPPTPASAGCGRPSPPTEEG